MIGLRAPRHTIVDSINLLNKLKNNIDDFKIEIKKNRPEVKKRIEDIKLLKQIFAQLDDVLEDFSNIYVGDVIVKEWDYLFPQIIQSLIDIEYFMKNQFPRVFGFNAARELSSYVEFQRSIARIKKLGSGQQISLPPTKNAANEIVNKIQGTASVLPSFLPKGHPGACGKLPFGDSFANMSLFDKMVNFGGRYKVNGKHLEPFCRGGSNEESPGDNTPGWMLFTGNALVDPGAWNCCPLPGTCTDILYWWENLLWFSISIIESTQDTQEGHPNNSKGGCGRDFSLYYQNIADSTSEENPITVSLFPDYSEDMSTDGSDSRDHMWVKITFATASVNSAGRFTLSDVVSVDHPVESGRSFNLIGASRVSCDSDGSSCQNDTSWIRYTNPTYYYVFFEQDWVSIAKSEYLGSTIADVASHERGIRIDGDRKYAPGQKQEKGEDPPPPIGPLEIK
tara:strand:- start:1145 stop:2497 length:1353 start_codon:yes stop_codon:yes gene_type:complete